MELYKDHTQSPKKRAQDLLARMTIDEKMAQVTSAYAGFAKIDDDIKNGIGELPTLRMVGFKTLKEALEWRDNLQKRVLANSPHKIPATFHMEGLCGAYIPGATSFPAGISRGASWDPELERRIGEVVSRQERALGITRILAPVLDISRDSRMGRQGETYGEDPTISATLGSEFTKGIQNSHSQGLKADAVAKHFLGFHNAQGGIHGANSDTPPRLLQEIYGKSFQAAISNAHLKGVMPCYASINGEPASSSKPLMTGLLRDEMGFDGVVVADYSSVSNVHKVQKLYNSLEEAGLHCMDAGVDSELPERDAYNEQLKEQFENGTADIEILNKAVLRNLESKFRMGLFEQPFALRGDKFKSEFSQPQDQQITRQSALESLVLLKNDGVLPIKKEVKRIAVVGCHAKNARSFFGGYTHLSMVETYYAAANAMAGTQRKDGDLEATSKVPGTQIESDETPQFDEILPLLSPQSKNLFEEMQVQFPNAEITYAYGYPIAGDDQSHFDEALKLISEADLCVMTLGGKTGSNSLSTMGEGVDSTDINLPVCQDAFIKKAAKLNKPLIGVHLHGRPISSDAADQYLNAILEAWNPSEAGAFAITSTLKGTNNPSGKLPVSVAYNAGQIPIYYNHPNGSAYHQARSIGFQNYVDRPHTPRYFFGHGLSYTHYDYTNLTLSQTQVAPGANLKISFDLKNSGSVAGTEIVQLYLSDRYASMTRPVMELVGFARVPLKAGEQKKITFTVEPSVMAFLDKNMQWKIEKGDIDIKVGASSNDIRCEGHFNITEDLFIEGRNRAFSAKANIE